MAKKTKIKTRPWDSAEYIKTEEDVAAYLEAALEDGDLTLIAEVMGNIARSKGLAKVAKTAKLKRDEVARAFSKKGSQKFLAVLALANAVGYRVTLTKADA